MRLNFLRKVSTGFLLLLFSSSSSFANNLLSTKDKNDDIIQLLSMVKSSYGPLQYKSELLGLDIDALEQEFLERAETTSNNGEFYYLINELVGRFQDSHFGSSLPTDHVAHLPFQVDLIKGKLLIQWIDRKALPESEFSAQIGDEIISLNDTESMLVLDEIKKFYGDGNPKTELRFAARLFAYRPGRIVPVPQNDKAKLVVRRGLSDIFETYQLKWKYTGTPLDEWTDKNLSLSGSRKPYIHNLYLGEQIKKNLGSRFESSYACSGKTRIAIPDDATMIMKEPFVAYYHPTDKGNIGYLRIPHYYPVNKITGEFEFDLRFEQYRYALDKLEANTVGLVIDQDHNCGGSVYYLENIVGLFALEDYAPMQFTFRAEKSDYLQFKAWLNQSNPMTIEYEKFSTLVDLIKTTWMDGSFMTPMTSFSGKNFISPDKDVRYTKPILMLVDEMSGSGGDAFPSIMKGIGRAKLFGTQTMGAGGHVERKPALNQSGITLRMTRSLFYKPNGDAVENNGAIPDFDYETTRDDLLYQYRPYQKAYLNALFGLL